MTYFVSFKFYALLAVALAFYASARRMVKPDVALLPVNALFLFLLFNGDGQAVAVYALITISAWLWTRQLIVRADGGARSRALAVAVVALVAVLGLSKSPLICEPLFRHPVNLIGISYFTFKLIHYVCAASAGSIPNPSLLRFLNFMFFFPEFVSGPIGRIERFSDDLDHAHERRPSLEEALQAVHRISVGLFKKVVLASILSGFTLSGKSEAELTSLGPRQLMWGSYAYAFYLYFDFSGYCDMAIGVGRLLGLRMLENFASPFRAMDIRNFWNRWHITLSFWIRDYIFNPFFKELLTLFPRVSPTALSSLAIFCAFVLCGVWHGNALNFMAYGALHGVALAGQMLYRAYMKRKHRALYQALETRGWYNAVCWGLTFHFVVLTLLVFSLDVQRLKALSKAYGHG